MLDTIRKWLREDCASAVLLILVLTGLWLSVYIYGQLFLGDFFSNALATLIGIILGIPIALSINRRAELAAQTARKKEEEERTDKILTLIKGELEHNLSAVDKYH